MPANALDDHDFDDDFEWEDDTEDLADDAPAEVLPCPECQAEIYEDSEQCPVCGAYVTFPTHAWTGRSTAWVLLGLTGLIATLLALIFG